MGDPLIVAGTLALAELGIYFMKLQQFYGKKYESPECQKAMKLFVYLPTPLDVIAMEIHKQKHHGLESKIEV